MTQISRNELKELFKTGAKPSGDDFKAFIDSTLNIKDDGIEKPSGADSPLKITAQGADEKLLDFYAGETKTWSINQKSGLNISNAGGSKLFIDKSSGNVGLGTTNPRAKLEISDGDLKINRGNIDVTEGTIKAKKIEGEGACVTGMIIMWSGSKDTVPTGWALCDGSSDNIPDLRDRFIVAAGKSYKKGENGEPDTHLHRVNPPSTNLAINSAGNHTHKFPSTWYKRDLDKGGFTAIDTGSKDVKKQTTQRDGSHSHSGRVDIAPFDSGSSSSDPNRNRPKWYALCFIIKL